MKKGKTGSRSQESGVRSQKAETTDTAKGKKVELLPWSANPSAKSAASADKFTCGTCGHYVRLIGAAHSHRCGITHSVVWPEKEACLDFTAAARTARVRVNPASRRGAEAQRRAAR